MSWISKLAFWKKSDTSTKVKPSKSAPRKSGKRICVDAGHGMGNRSQGVFDPGACAGGHTEADIALAWAKQLSAALIALGHDVVMTRRDNKQPTPLRHRAGIAKANDCDMMISLHCNAAEGSANGTEVFYRGIENRNLAQHFAIAVSQSLGTRLRGAKTEPESARGTLAVMAFQPCFLIELGFIDNPGDRAKLIDDDAMFCAAREIAKIIL
jgi:N-acetylmuramoyl-L-alanine amidase